MRSLDGRVAGYCTMIEGHNYRRIICLGCGGHHDVPIFCGDRFCPVCSVVRLARVKHRLRFLVELQLPIKSCGFRHITLTLTSESDLPTMIRHLTKAFQRLRNRQVWQRAIIGGAYVIEITGKPGRWHAHIHAVVYGYWLRWADIMRAWRKVSGSRGVYITNIPRTAAVNYLSKYLAKPDIPDSVTAEIAKSLKGIRLFAPIGEWFSNNQAYDKPVHPCLICGSKSWGDYYIMRGEFPRPIWKTADEIAVEQAVFRNSLRSKCYES